MGSGNQQLEAPAAKTNAHVSTPCMARLALTREKGAGRGARALRGGLRGSFGGFMRRSMRGSGIHAMRHAGSCSTCTLDVEKWRWQGEHAQHTCMSSAECRERRPAAGGG